LVQNRIQTKENLLKKNCLDSDTCEVCNSATESAAHLIAGWSFSAGFWRKIGMELIAHFNAFLLLCCWRLWKHRHDVDSPMSIDM
jgi:hypothetical protein